LVVVSLTGWLIGFCLNGIATPCFSPRDAIMLLLYIALLARKMILKHAYSDTLTDKRCHTWNIVMAYAGLAWR